MTFDEGATAIYTIKLTTQPPAMVTLSISVAGGGEDNADDVSVSDSTISFDSSSWNTEKTITVRSLADQDAVDETATITHAVTSNNYVTGSPIGRVSVTVNDRQEPGVTVTKDPLIIINEGATGSYTIVLDTQPVGGNVTVTVDNPNTANLTTTPSVTFNASNWNTAMPVTMAPEDDDIDDDGESVILTHTVTGADYPVGLTIESVTVNIGDPDDTRGVTISETTQVLNEEDTSTYTVKLDSQPTAQVTILVESSNTAKVSVESPSTSRLLFTEGTGESRRR